jgi:hypothetical protein
MKTILPWIVAVIAIGGALFLFKVSQTKSSELANLKAEVQQLESLRAEIAEVKSQQVSAAEVAQLRKDKEDLLRLRNEVSQLRKDKLELVQQAQTAQVSIQRAQADTQRIQEQVKLLANAQAAGLAQVQQQVAAGNPCINNLRQIDGAKQQWALENQKTAEAIPTVQDITPYLRGGVLPACPQAGVYTINAVNALPTCSIAGHALPPQ